MTYISFNDLLTNPDKTVKQEYIDLNPVNLHLLWEPLILLFAKYLDRLDLGVSPNMLTDMQQSASAYNAKKVIEVGDKTFSVGPKMQLIMDYLNEKERYYNEMRDRNSNASNLSSNEDVNNDDSDDEIKFAISLSQHESKIEDLVNQLKILDEQRALEKLENASREEDISKLPAAKVSSPIPIPPPNMHNSNRNTTVNDKNQIKKVVSGDSRNLKNTNENDTDRYKNQTSVTGLWPVISESSGSGGFDDCETRNGNQKNAKSISRNYDDNRNNHFNVICPDNDDSERRSTHPKNDRRRTNDNTESNRNNYYNVSSPGNDDSERENDHHRTTRNSNSSNSINYNDRNNNYNVFNDRRQNNDNNDYNRNRNSDNNSSNSSNGNRSYRNSNNNYDKDSAAHKNDSNYTFNRSNNNCNATSYNTNKNNSRSNNNYSNNNGNNNNGYRSQQINYQDEPSSQSNRNQRLILSDKPSYRINRDHAPKVVLSNQDRRRGGLDRDDQDRWGKRDGDRGNRDGDDRGQGSSNQGRRGSRGSKDGDGDEQDDKSPRSTRIVLSDQRRTSRGNREDGEEPDNIQGVQTLSLSDRFQMFNKGRGKAKDR